MTEVEKILNELFDGLNFVNTEQIDFTKAKLQLKKLVEGCKTIDEVKRMFE